MASALRYAVHRANLGGRDLRRAWRQTDVAIKWVARKQSLGSAHWSVLHALSIQGIEVESTTGGGAPAAFPWRGYSIEVRYLDLPRKVFHLMEKRMWGSEKFEAVAVRALHMVTAAIFQLSTAEVVAPLERGSGEGEGKEGWDQHAAAGDPLSPEKAMVVDPKDVMEKELADFFLHAQVAVKCCSQQAVYRLHSVGRTNTAVVHLVSVDTKHKILSRPTSAYNFTGWMKFLSEILELARNSDLDFTLEAQVDVPCIETFYVKDIKTDRVVQGACAPSERVHRLTLECTLGIEHLVTETKEVGSERNPFGWKVTDLDGWVTNIQMDT
ncbi:unnamed protein product [Discosporangium mesarthrocarpum]